MKSKDLQNNCTI